ncbi:UNVERIFIED_CONTAM: hypothetical protein Sangu_0366200 [Sesamum angustifolium]|uniref:Reverse transcriptase domain-containing protein n=1 Tax=Sesamum angustifolium TaxID=2727405 RepID=A0AAW2QT09_9LAMI
MPRSSLIGELTFDPEIEKTARRLRWETKQHTEEASTSYEDGKDITLEFEESSGESEEEVMAIVSERTINDMTSPDLNQQPLCIEYPDLELNFELKSGLIHLLPTFRGLAGEDPHKHLKEFHVVLLRYATTRSHRRTNQIKSLSFLSCRSSERLAIFPTFGIRYNLERPQETVPREIFPCLASYENPQGDKRNLPICRRKPL